MQKKKKSQTASRLLGVPGTNQIGRSDVSNQAPLVYHTWYVYWYNSVSAGYIWAKQRARSPHVCSGPATLAALLPLPSPYLLVGYANVTGSKVHSSESAPAPATLLPLPSPLLLVQYAHVTGPKVHSCALFAERTGVAPDPRSTTLGTSGFDDWAPVVLQKYHDQQACSCACSFSTWSSY